jgi:hypothetical protein|tara:strand:+ start:3014 stop:3508 length:495 start_codon:yes stop_codon:yes gene_type:complete
MTNEERRQYLISFMRRHRLSAIEMARLIDRDRFWLSRARNTAGDFRIPRIVSDYLMIIDLLPSNIKASVLRGEIPEIEPKVELLSVDVNELGFNEQDAGQVSLSTEENALNRKHLNEAGRDILQRFASIIDGSPVEVLKRASNQLISLELTKRRAVPDKLEAAE